MIILLTNDWNRTSIDPIRKDEIEVRGEKEGVENRRKKRKGGGNVPVARRSREVYRAFEFMYSQSCTVPAILRLSPLVLLCSLSIRFQPSRYHERNVRRRRKRPATVEDISRVVYDSLRKEFNGADVWILRFCVKRGTRMAFGNIGIRTREGEGFYCALARFISSYYLRVIVV